MRYSDWSQQDRVCKYVEQLSFLTNSYETDGLPNRRLRLINFELCMYAGRVVSYLSRGTVKRCPFST